MTLGSVSSAFNSANASNRNFSDFCQRYRDELSKNLSVTNDKSESFPAILYSVREYMVDSNSHDQYMNRRSMTLNRIRTDMFTVVSDIDDRPLTIVTKDPVGYSSDNIDLYENNKSVEYNLNIQV